MLSKKFLTAALILIGLILLGGIYYFWFQSKPKETTNDLPPVRQEIGNRYAQKQPVNQQDTVSKNQNSTDTISSDEIAFLKKVYGSSYGLSFQYPSNLFVANVDNDGSMSAALNPNYSGQELSGISIQIIPFNTKFDVAMDSYGLRYDQTSNKWTRATSGYNIDTYGDFVPSCEKNVTVGTQQVPAYDVSYKYRREYVLISKQGLLDISEVPVEEPIPPEAHKTFDMMVHSLIFDHPESIVKAGCN